MSRLPVRRKKKNTTKKTKTVSGHCVVRLRVMCSVKEATQQQQPLTQADRH